MHDLISVIVPVYKVEEYLDESVGSAVSQSYRNLEIILVDDGSPDSCGAMCDEWAKKDSRIRVIHKQNGGLSSARNAGLDAATGDWIAFLDSDDLLEPDAYEKALALAKSNGADTAIFSFYRLTETGKLPFDERLPEGVWQGDDVRHRVLYALFSVFPADRHFIPTVWRMLYSRDIIERGSLRFQSERELLAEDLLWDLDYYPHCRRVAVSSERLYTYRDNQGYSFSSKYIPYRWAATKAQHAEILKKCAANGLPEGEYIHRAEAQFLAMASVAVKKEVKAQKQLGSAQANANIDAILSDPELQGALTEYNGPALPLPLRVFCALARRKMRGALVLLIRLYLLLGLEK